LNKYNVRDANCEKVPYKGTNSVILNQLFPSMFDCIYGKQRVKKKFL